MKKLYILTLASLLMAACAEDIDNNNISSQYITFNVTDQNYLPDPVEDTRSAQASPFEGEAQEFTPQNSLFTYNTATKTPTIDQTPVETDLDEDLCLITTVEDGIHLDNAAATTRGGQVSSGTFSFGVTEYKNGGSVVSTFNNVQFSGVTVSTSSQKVNTGKTWESDAGSNNYDFYACYPYLTAGAAASNGLSLTPDCKTITYDCSGVTVANQQDLMTAYTSSTYNKDGISLAFGHRLCAVKIVLSSSWNTSYTIKSINFSSISKSGTYNIATDTWGSLGTAGSYDVSGITEANTVDGEVAVYLMMIPQTLSSCDMTITLQKSGESTTSTLKTTLANKTWTAGKTVTLTIGPSVISSVTVTYPTGWTKTTANDTPGPVTTYTTGDKFGLFAVDKNNKIVISNVPLTAPTTNSATQTITLPSGYLYSSQYTYYLMYPYSTSATGISALAVGATATYGADADTFFGDVISGWNVQADQSTADKSNLKSSDLQIAKLGTNFAMVHKMGLYILYGGSSSIVTAKYYVSGYSTYYWIHNSTAIHAKSSTSYTSTAKLYVNNNIYYYLVKDGVATNFSANNEFSNSDGTNEWSKSSIVVNGGQCKTEILPSPTMTCQNWTAYAIAKGDVFYTDGALAHSGSQYTTTSSRTPAGIVVYIPSTNAEKAYAESGYGAGHALIMSLKNVSSLKIWSKNSGHVSGLTACTTLATARADASGMKNCSYMNNATNYPAAYAALHYGVTVPTTAPNKTTGWFLPSIGQWMKVGCFMENCAETQILYDSEPGGPFLTNTNNALKVVGSGNYNSIFYDDPTYGVSAYYMWTSTEYNDYGVNRVITSETRLKWDSAADDGSDEKTTYQGVVRPFLAL